jgi:GT2 family glycosyltransferase/LmbE family N-acetylglucosaminyl deacetylase
MDGFPPLLPLRPVSNCALVVAPHADDEVLGCGGALALHAQHGDKTRVLVLTAAEGSARLEESRKAGALLGVGEVQGLGLVDGEISRSHDLVKTLRRAFEASGADLFYLPAPTEAHPDHRAASLASAAAVAGIEGARVLFYGINRAPNSNRLLDVSLVADTKDEALGCFASQQARLGEWSQHVDLAAGAEVDLEGVERVESFVDLSAAQASPFCVQAVRLLQSLPDVTLSAAPDSNSSGPRVSAVISTWNKAADLADNLCGLRAQTRPFDEIVVVDNASSDDTAKRILSDYPEVRLIVMPHDKYGACETFNLGFSSASGELIAILDDDVVLTPGWLEGALGRLNQEPESTAVISTKIVEPGMPETYKNSVAINTERYMSTFRGCASLARKADIAAAGYYDTRLFIYGNERDLTCRLLNLGKRVLQYPGVEAFHQTPFGLHMGKRSLFYHARNAWLSMLKYAPLKDLLAMPWLVLTKVLLRGKSQEDEGAVTDAVGTIGIGRSLRETPGAFWVLVRASFSVLWNLPYCLRHREPVRHPDFELPLK